MSVLNGRSFNVRLHIDENGAIALGWVHGLYEVSECITDIKSIPAEEQAVLAQALGVRYSNNPHVARLLRTADPVAALDAALGEVVENVLEKAA